MRLLKEALLAEFKSIKDAMDFKFNQQNLIIE